MTFDELWERVCSPSDLPEGARMHLPSSLTDRTKKLILEKKLSPDELSHIILNTISTINSGSTETIDDLVMKSLEREISNDREAFVADNPTMVNEEQC